MNHILMILKVFRNVIIHKLYRLKGVPKTTYLQRGSLISKDILIGEHSFIAPFCNIGAGVELGSYVMIASHSKIVGGDHRMDLVGSPMIFSGRDKLKRTIVEDDVWIGSGVTILSGVRIGFGAVVGAGSVVTKDIEPLSVNVGVPSRKISNRFPNHADEILHKEVINKKGFSINYAKRRYQS